MNRPKNIAENRFAACTRGGRLLIFLPEAARCATAGRFSFEIHFSAGDFFCGQTIPATTRNRFTRREIFRGKISRRNNQQPKITSTNGRASATKTL
jgi:hypothetical protein